MTSPFEQLAEAIQRLVEETVARTLAARVPTSPDASLTTKQVAELLSYDPSFVLRLAKARILKSDGAGRGRRYRPEYVEDFRRRLKAQGGRIWDVEVGSSSGGRGATAPH